METRTAQLVRSAGVRIIAGLRDWSELLPPSPGRRWLRWVTWAAAVALTVAAAGTSGAVIDLDRTGAGLAPFLGALGGLPFALILTRPALGWLVSAASAIVIAAALPLVDADPWPWPVPHGLTLLALLGAVCAREPLARAAVAWLSTCLLFAWGVPPDIAPGWVVGVSSVAVIGLLAGRLARSNRRLAEQAARSEREQARRVVLEERARIARDLHDVVAHHMSLVVVQAETAPYRVPDLPDAARAELDAISEVARSALSETRSLLTVLRREDDTPAHAPQPGLDQLPDLVDATRRAGVQLDTDVAGQLDDLRPGTSLAAYRIAQEALANAARHAPGAPVRLVLRRDGPAVRLQVENGPPPGPPGEPGPPGHGITGMRERARAEGGELTIVRSPDGRFAVEALLPTGVRA